MDPTNDRPPALKITAFGNTHIGQVRIHNEDAILMRPELDLYILADGAGGHNAGNVASALATTSIANHVESTAEAAANKPEIDRFGLYVDARRLAAAVVYANKAIVEIAKTSNRYRGMGTTVVAAIFSRATSTMHVAHVGDSRCYRLRGPHIEQLTHDHSLLNDILQEHPDADDAAVARLPSNVITRALGVSEHLRVDVRSFNVAPGDRYLMCSDGLTSELDDESIAATMGPPRVANEAVRALIHAANFAGGHDNIASIVVVCDAAEDAFKATRRDPRPRRQPSLPDMPPPMRGVFGSAPEIVVVDVEHHTEDSAPIVVPNESASPSLLQAFAGLSKRRPPPQPV